MLKLKALGDAGWKELAAKNKLKDNGLLKALQRLPKVDADAHDEVAKVLAEIGKLAQALKKDRAVSALPDVVESLDEMLEAVETAGRQLDKDRAAHEKQQKAQAAAEARKKKDDEAEAGEEEQESPELLTTKLKPLVRLVLQGDTLHALVARSGKKAVVMLARKPIPPARRRMLFEELGGGSTKYYPGTCRLEAGVVTFSLSAEVAGLTKLVKLALLEQTGLRVNKLKCRGHDGDDNDEG